MDPIGPWYVSYNRLLPANAPTTFQTATLNTNTDLVTHHLATAVAQTVPCATTQPQLIIQAAHTNPTVATQSATFNPGGFLSPTPVTYDVFTPLFHPTTKQINYIPQRQAITQAQVVAGTKLNSQIDSEIPVIRTSYATPQQSENTFFEAQTTTNTTAATVVPWPQQTAAQLSNTFGVLSADSIVPSSTVSSVTKPNNVTYSNSFSSSFPTVQSINNTISQITLPIGTVEIKTLGFTDQLKAAEAAKAASTNSLVTTSQTYFQPTTFDSSTLTNSFSNNNNNNNNNDQPTVNTSTIQPTCIVTASQNTTNRTDQLSRSPLTSSAYSTTNISTSPPEKSLTSPNNNFASPPNKTPPTSVQSNSQSDMFSDVRGTSTHQQTMQETSIHENCQTSPLSFTMMDTQTLNYSANTSPNCSTSKQSSGSTPQYQIMNQPQTQNSYRQYSTGSTSDSEYHNPGRSKSVASTDSAYSSNTSQNGPDCAIGMTRRPSPLQNHSQASPLGHVSSPVYPMYNSPMANMSSPSPLQHSDSSINQCSSSTPYKSSMQSQMTPPSPMEIPRPSSQSQAAHSSVITRALGTSNNNKTCYENDANSYNNHQEYSQIQKQVCWQSSNSNQRKYSISDFDTSDNNIVELTVPSLSSQNRILNIPERQPFYETETINLQDLSSCRSDPMNIVKNLQSIQHNPTNSCRIEHESLSNDTASKDSQEVDDTHKIEYISKKKMFLDKCNQEQSMQLSSSSAVNDYLNRISRVTNHNMNNLNHHQQNNYYDLDFGPLSAGKTFQENSSSSYSSPTVANVYSNNYTRNTPPHSSLNNSAASTPNSYYNNTYHNNGYNSTVDLSSLNYSQNPCISTQNSSYNHHQYVPSPKDEQPRVIVPDIEEELGFLQQPLPITDHPPKDSSISNKSKADSGFMTSFLKFLKGDKESTQTEKSPASIVKTAQSWKKSYEMVQQRKKEENKLENHSAQMETQKLNEVTMDYTNDPRYFPLPKERKDNNFESSDDGFSSEDDSFTPKRVPPQKIKIIPPTPEPRIKPADNKPKKGRPIKPGGPTDRKRKALEAAAAAAEAAAAAGLQPSFSHKKQKKKSQQIPRREISKRKAKEKTEKRNRDGEEVEEEGYSDKEIDPAWTPTAKPPEVAILEEKKKRRGRPPNHLKRKIAAENELQENYSPKKPGRKKRIDTGTTGLFCKINEKLLASANDKDLDISPFKSGDFVIIKSDLHQESPPLWRIDGKTLLQKYEPEINENGKMLYKNISTYSGWGHKNRLLYLQVPVKIMKDSKQETIVELLREEMLADNRYSEMVLQFLKDSEKYQDNFEVYIQTLISQALDSNFLTEIFQEQDEYFLSNVKVIDDITDEKRRKLLSTTNWAPNIISALTTWPCVNILEWETTPALRAELESTECNGCDEPKSHSKIILYGQPYNSTTLEASRTDLQENREKEFWFCRFCEKKVFWFNKVTHQKHSMFCECARRVLDKKAADPLKDTTIILNELLADELWLNHLFKEVRSVWAEIDSLKERTMKMAESTENKKDASPNHQTNDDGSDILFNNDTWKSLMHETCSQI